MGKTAFARESAGWDGMETAARIRRGEVSALEVTEAAIARAEAAQPQLNILVCDRFDAARREAAAPPAGPLHGVPTLIKDLNNLRGAPTRYGAGWSRHAAAHAGEHTPYMDAYLATGMVPLGKSATPEYGFMPTTEPLALGPTRNPWNMDRSPGGSSGGAAAAVAAGVVPVAHASDGGGSIRIPASACGLFGLKPSRGRMQPYEPSRRAIDLGVQHVVSRTVRDSAAAFAVTERAEGEGPFRPVGPVDEASPRRLRVGVLTANLTGREPDPEVRTAVETAAALLQRLGHTVRPTAWPVDGPAFSRAFGFQWFSSAAQLIEEIGAALGRTPTEQDLEPYTFASAAAVGRLPAGGLEQALATLQAAEPAYAAWFDDLDVVVSPVLGQAPPPIGWLRPDVEPETLGRRIGDFVGYTQLHNVVGAPAMSVPLHWTANGLPIGVQVAARVGAEAILLGLAYELEAAQPWRDRRPPVWLG